MRALLTLIISFCLLHIQVYVSYNSYGFGFTKAHATDNQNGNNGSGDSVTPGAGTVSGVGVEATQEEQTYTVQDESENPSLTGSFIVQALMMFVIVVPAPAILANCSGVLDVWIYGATALYYIAMEVINYGKYKKGSEQEMSIYANKDKDEQIEAMNAAYEETKQAAEAAHKKAGFALHAGIGFTLAAVVLMVMIALKYTSMDFSLSTLMCLITVDGSKKSPTENFFAFNQMEYQAQIDSESDPLLSYISEEKSCSEDSVKLKEEAYYAEEIYVKASKTNKEFEEIKSLAAKFNPDFDKMIKDVEKHKTHQSKLQKVLDYFVSPAQADAGFLSGLGLGAVGLAAYFIFDKSFGVWLRNLMWDAWPRVAAYGIMAGLAYILHGMVKSSAKKLDERAEQYKNLAEQMQMQMNGFQIESGGGFSNINRGQGPESSIDDTEKTTKTDGCFTGKPGQLKQDPNCLCKKANNCKQMEMPKVSFSGMSTPGIISEPMSMFKKSGNNLYSGNLAGAQTSAAGLGQYAGKLGKFRRKIMGNVQKTLKDNGKPLVPIGKLQSKAAIAFRKAFDDGLSKLPDDLKNDLMKLDTPIEDKSVTNKEMASAKPAPAAKPASPNQKSNKDGFMGFDFADDESSDEAVVDPDAIAANMTEDEGFGGDITDRPDEDIFKIINTRYLKSAYPIFFEEEGGAPPQKISE